MKFKIQILIEDKWETFTWEELNETILFGNDLSLHPRRLYTGKKDKNNNDIFEGDIIKVDEVDSTWPTVGKLEISQTFQKAVVTWDKQLLTFMYNPVRHGIDYKTYSHQMLGYGANIEILGNISENPELL